MIAVQVGDKNAANTAGANGGMQNSVLRRLAAIKKPGLRCRAVEIKRQRGNIA